MPKTTKILSMIILLLTMGWSTVRAEEVLPLRLQELTDDAYRYYSSRETDDFFEARCLALYAIFFPVFIITGKLCLFQ